VQPRIVPRPSPASEPNTSAVRDPSLEYPHRHGSFLAWVAGVRISVLRRAESERLLFSVLGMTVLFTCLYQAIAATYALHIALHATLGLAGALGLIWGAAIMTFDRMILIIGFGRNRWLAFISILPRIGFAALLGFSVAVILALGIFRFEINEQTTADQRKALSTQVAKIDKTYNTTVMADERDISDWQSKESQRQEAVTKDLFLYHCEIGYPDCSTSRVRGNGAYAHLYLSEAATAQSSLKALVPIANQRISADRADIATQGAIRETDLIAARRADAQGVGLLADIEGLGQLAAGHTDAAWTVRLVTLIFVSLDLMPAIAKALLVLNGRSVYEQLNEDDQRAELVTGYEVRRRAEVDHDRIDDWADSERDVNRNLIDIERERRIDEAMAVAHTEFSRSYETANHNASVRTPNLVTLVEEGFAQERMRVPLASALRHGALVGLSLIVVLCAVLATLSAALHVAINAQWVAYLALLLAAVLALYTRGFASSPAWAHRAAFATLLAGIALPVFITLANVNF
jgi:hypothetical protein